MEYVLTGAEMAMCDRRTSDGMGIPSLVLMERAALTVAEGVSRYFRTNKRKNGIVLAVAGRGNNGADALAAGRILLERGTDVRFCRLSGAVSPDSSFAVQETILRSWGVSVEIFSAEKLMAKILPAPAQADAYRPDSVFLEETPAACAAGMPLDQTDPDGPGRVPAQVSGIPDVIIDGLFGTGLSRDLSGEAAEAVRTINCLRERFGCHVIAVDIPSGISSDDGSIMGCAVRCDETMTFAFLKRGHLMYPGASFAGDCHLAQIGITSLAFPKPPGMFTMSGERARDLMPPRDPAGNKGTFGKVLLIAGRRNMCGAALLAAGACMASGAGMVKIFTHDSNRLILQQSLPEALLETYTEDELPETITGKLLASLSWADIAAAGPGMGTDAAAEHLFRELLKYAAVGSLRGLVLDADALRILARDSAAGDLLSGRPAGIPCILTPHMAEFAALAGCSVSECKKRRTILVQEQADRFRCTILCKDARTIAAAPSPADDSLLYLNRTGNSGMAAAGSGDVLTGMTAAILALTTSKAGADLPALRAFTPRRRREGFDAACIAAHLHGLAGDYARAAHGGEGMKAGDLLAPLRMSFFWE